MGGGGRFLPLLLQFAVLWSLSCWVLSNVWAPWLLRNKVTIRIGPVKIQAWKYFQNLCLVVCLWRALTTLSGYGLSVAIRYWLLECSAKTVFLAGARGPDSRLGCWLLSVLLFLGHAPGALLYLVVSSCCDSRLKEQIACFLEGILQLEETHSWGGLSCLVNVPMVRRGLLASDITHWGCFRFPQLSFLNIGVHDCGSTFSHSATGICNRGIPGTTDGTELPRVQWQLWQLLILSALSCFLRVAEVRSAAG